MTKTASWSIVTTVLGVPETILPSIAHHLQSDAAVIYVYLDAPNPVVEQALAKHPRCDVTVCDDRYWMRRPEGRPQGVVARQIHNARDAKRRKGTEWLIHIDADEFLVPWTDGMPSLSEELASIPGNIEWARIRNLERIFLPEMAQENIFDGVFRDQTPNKFLQQQVYGEASVFLSNGFSGYTRGKVAIRSESKFKPRLHHVLWAGPPRPGLNPIAPRIEDMPPFHVLQNTRILHFEGWTALHWITKLLKFADAGVIKGHGPGRNRQVQFMLDTSNVAERIALFDKIQRLSASAAALMKGRGLLRLQPFDASGAARAAFPDVPMDFSALAFDKRIFQSDPDFFRRHGLAD